MTATTTTQAPRHDFPLQATVGSTDGINFASLIAAIEAGYRTHDGRTVRVHIGRGASDGLPPGMLYLSSVEQSATIG